MLTGHAVADDGREGRGIGVDYAARLEVGVGLVVEVEGPVFVIGEEGETVEVGGGGPELGYQVGVDGLVNGEGTGREERGGEERLDGGELHDDVEERTLCSDGERRECLVE